MATTNIRSMEWTHAQMLEDGWPERIASAAYKASVLAVCAAGGGAVQWMVMSVFSARMFALLSLGALALVICSWATLFLALVAMGERRDR